MTLVLVTPASEYPVSLDEAKVQCAAAGTSDFDTQLTGYIAAACDAAEQYLGKALAEQSWKLVLDGWPDVIELPFGPIAASPVVKYVDDSGIERTATTDVYDVDIYGSPPRLQPVQGQT